MWLGRFTKGTALERAMPSTPGNVDVHAEWDALKAARIVLDEELIAWADSLDANWLSQDFSWHSGMTKTTRSKPSWLLVTHMFNHQTHHRGQVTTLLSQQKIDLGATDLMMMPSQNS